MSLHTSSVLVKMTIRSWEPYKKDRKVTERVDQEFQTAGEAGNYNKRLLDRAALAPIQKVVSRLRAEHARMTMPWCYDGVALLPSKLFMEYTEVMRALRDQHEVAVGNLVAQYPAHRAAQAQRLGALYDPDDYPDARVLRERFGVAHSFFPVPQSEHFIVDLEAEDARRIKDAFSREYADTARRALESLYERVELLVGRVHERLSDPDYDVRTSLVTNLESLVDVLPELNVFDDPTLTRVCRELRTRVLVADRDTLASAPVVREQVASAAFDIAALLRGDHLRQAAA